MHWRHSSLQPIKCITFKTYEIVFGEIATRINVDGFYEVFFYEGRGDIIGIFHISIWDVDGKNKGLRL